jgi:uncharacterized phage protein (TIGR01671 family)
VNREIKFRGKSKRTEEWIYGDLIQDLTANRFAIVPQETGDFNYYDYEIIPETRGQYTGETDKNKKEIYEGDLILFQKFANWDDNNEKLKRCLGKVKFLEGCFMWEVIKSSNFNKFFPIHRNEPLNHTCGTWGLEVIGNIYENPELLEDK